LSRGRGGGARRQSGRLPGTELTADSCFWERELAARGYRAVVGLDEAGRGPLAGPVVAAAVILPPDGDAACYRDSKVLSAARREVLCDLLRESGARVGVALATAAEIDRVNILRASLLAMRRAVELLAGEAGRPAPDFLLVDGTMPVPLPLPQQTLVRGEQASASIAAASIVAKVTRDRLMDELDQQFPDYQFRRHKGYPTALHRELLLRLGPCPAHRRGFRGVRELETDRDETLGP